MMRTRAVTLKTYIAPPPSRKCVYIAPPSFEQMVESCEYRKYPNYPRVGDSIHLTTRDEEQNLVIKHYNVKSVQMRVVMDDKPTAQLGYVDYNDGEHDTVVVLSEDRLPRL